MTRSLLAVALLANGCLSLSPESASQGLGTAVEGLIDDDRVRHAVLHVDAPHKGVSGTWAAGVADVQTGAPMAADTPFLSASIGKLIVAATVFDLVDDGLLRLDDPVSRWVATETLRGLPAHGGDAGFDAITVRMLLAHRSGLPDPFDTSTHPARDGAPSLMEAWVAEPERTWTRDQLLDYARDHFDPHGPPGEGFLYSDLNYDLLGLVIEGVTGRPYPALVRERVLDPLGMTRTWYHHLEPRPDGVPRYADVWADDVNLARAPALSGDQAGGGLATTAADLGRLMRGLERGEPVALDRLATDWTVDAIDAGLDYGYGTWRWRPGGISLLLRGQPGLRGASGSTNAFAYLTDDGTVLTGTLDQFDRPSRHVEFLLMEVLPTLGRVPDQGG